MKKNASPDVLRIGMSSCMFHADPLRPIFKGKTLLYWVEPMSDWLLAHGAMPWAIPTIPARSLVGLNRYVDDLDGLILHGGADVAPQSYGETPLRPEWSGDLIRDRYEIALVKEFRAQKKPILGICRGMQLLNVALGGTLYQDITTQVPASFVHRDWDVYDQNFHKVTWSSTSFLSKVYGAQGPHTVNSIHHQGVKDLAPGLREEARSVTDGIVEAVKWEGDEFMLGVQWHPEFQGSQDRELSLSSTPLLQAFLDEVQSRRRS